MCHDMTLAVKVALNPNSTNQSESRLCGKELNLYYTVLNLSDPEYCGERRKCW